MALAETRTSIAIDGQTLDQVDGLLRRYPDITPEECDVIGRFLATGAAIDIGLLSSSRDSWEASERFRAENPRYFRIGARGYVGLLMAAALLIVGLVLLKDCALR